MYHYLFTNDLRISTLDESMKSAAKAIQNNTVPTAAQDKSQNNNTNTLKFYFNLIENSNCCKLAERGNTRKVVLNFIKKFQFPNTRTQAAYRDSIDDNITLAPMRVIIKVLYLFSFLFAGDEAYVTTDEINKFIFFDSEVAKNRNYSALKIIINITNYRSNQSSPNNLPATVETNSNNIEWNQQDRQFREMIKILNWSGCIKQQGDKLYIDNKSLTEQNKADIFDIINYNEFWNLDPNESDFNKVIESYQSYMDIQDADNTEDTPDDGELVFDTGYNVPDSILKKYPDAIQRNRIFFGAPGTGKSFSLNKQKDELLSNGGEYERVTFHPDYSYAHFVGTYKPVPCKDNNDNDAITYEYVPGPFMRTLVKALRNGRTTDVKPFVLLIEEINRANVAAVFGDVFQLLDRKRYVSEYPIQATEDMKKYLSKELNIPLEKCSEIRIPSNMFIWATMNSADQGVFPMDTAFKRRWDFTYIGINDEEKDIANKSVTLGNGKFKRELKWNELRKAINTELLRYKVNEDKLLGPYFISNDVLGSGNDIEPSEFSRVFKNKVLMYLFDDAARQKRSELFSGCSQNNLYSAICKEFDDKGVFIFCSEISKRFLSTPASNDSADEAENLADEPEED